ncbi:N-acetylglucosamine-6-phosphate deacetylase [Actinopolymorpha cephalotaxi]|uniref:N-acetylglucosamine-6-phosphate deacetylase n=1 Tax=Actinopolymorpha cephalotaxi TaxID=504797 RepID=A0A1I2QW60_9ACTN|nr:amidohydrolase family protein [Actinopolymorpha cephalotaxi]NYH82446.1 N-acetylglucosamine-6-phosphate deacetylase [Actinopolymorpha cephalotaxi]SFG32805.1 N-acetylglucosamine-6-phosphate deacetylase [Actinopolymorpha cephalotaxi]
MNPGPAFEIAGRDPATGRRCTVELAGGLITQVHVDSPDTSAGGTDATNHTDSTPDATETEPWLAPGLVDLQVNGFAGFDVNAADAEPDTIGAMVRALWKVGVTTVVPTIVTASEEHIVTCLRRVAAARADDPMVRHAVPYVHVEGPHLSAEDGPRGVHDADQIRPPDVAEFDRWQRAGAGLVGMVTLSPHFAGSTHYISALAERGVWVSVGHTGATPEQIHAAADAGARLSTHLGNGAHAVLARHPNYVWAQLADDRLTAGFIADGHHLPADTLIAMLAAKGPERSILVSDATTLAGSPPGVYQTPVGGAVELTAQGRLSHVGTPYLAGAARPVTDGVAHVANLGRFSLAEALALATTSPGRFVGGRGRLEVGASADLVTFHWSPGNPTLTVEQVVAAGTPVVG